MVVVTTACTACASSEEDSNGTASTGTETVDTRDGTETTDPATSDDATSDDATTVDPTTVDPTTSPSTDTDSLTDAESDSSSDTDTDGPPLDCSDGGWTCVAVDPVGPYAQRTFDVPAAQNWLNTGLYLEAGEQAILDESGSWFVNDNEGNSIDHGPCVIGDLVARIGLHYKDPALTCVAGEQVVFTADKPGILYLGALPSNDLGETYETRAKATGAKQVTLISEGHTVPTVDADAAASYGFETIASGWVEVRGQHVILTLPTATAAQDADILADATELLDAMYELHAELRGALPQHGQRIRFFPDPNIEGIGYMLAGNPVRMDAVLVAADYSNRISNAGEPGVDVWGFAHELGHDFTFVNALWWYQENSLESWPNIFSIHALEALDLEIHANALNCEGAPPVAYDGWDAWSGLCFLLEFQTAYGWEFYANFFAVLNTTPHGDVPGGPMAWHWIHDQFEALTGEDLTPTFAAWSVPNPG